MIPAGALIVSCQAREGNPLRGSAFMAAMACAAIAGGARGIRADGPDDIAAIRAVTKLPLIGLNKRWEEGFPVYITPDFASAQAIVAAGADIVALDATPRRRNGEPVGALIGRIRVELGVKVLADVAVLAEGLAAAAAGVDFVATTLSGYTDDAPGQDGPDFALLEALARGCAVPVIAEGRFDTPAAVARAFALGAYAVVVGTAITNPMAITRRFVAAAPG